MNTFTGHAIQRVNQRSISQEEIDYTLAMGKFFYRQQLLFYVSPDDNLVVVTSNPDVSGDFIIITSYYRKNAMKYIKRKSKKRYKNLAA